LTGLKPFTKYYVKAYVTNTFGVFTGGVDSLITRDGLPLVGAISIKDLGYTNVTLTSSASNNSDETVEIIERGFYCWSSIPSDTIIKCGTGTGAFEKIISNLVAQREYFARPYVISNLRSTDTIFGNPVSFYTKTDVPTVSTEPVTNIQNGSAIVKGLVVNQGMTTVTASGICWSTTNPLPLLSDQVLPLALDASNAFTGYLNGLSGGTTYYVRAFATNSEGTAYGNTEQFTTPSVFTLLASFPGATRRPNSTAYTMTTNGSTLFLLCGDLGANYTDELWAYSVSANLWEQRKPFKGSVKGAKWQTAIGYGNGFYVYGGVDFDDTGISDLYYYNATDNDWEVKTNISGDTLRIDTMYNSVGFNYSNGFYLFGGKNYAATDTVKNDAWKFYHDAREWHKLNEFPVKQYGGVAAYIDGIAYVGMGKDDANICNSRIWAGIDQLNDTIDWTLKTTCTIYTGGILTGVASNAAHSIYMIDEDFYILEYNTITNVWRKKSRLPEHTGIYCMYEIGGSIYIGTYRNAFYKYEPSWDN
ncbi:MAG: hypothetical protein LBS80_02330, partial [Tannerella sp.]|nr:hypothetical protein [Tannerella sp.]